MFTEFRILILLAEKMRPKIVKALKTAYRIGASKELQNDFSAFENFIYRFAEMSFKQLFTNLLVFEDTLRAWDFMLIFGFEFIHKLTIAILRQFEDFICESVKREVKILKVGRSVDALIIAGNLTLGKISRRAGKLKIDEILQKCLKKESYKMIRRLDYLLKAQLIERNNNYRLVRIFQTKEILKNSGFCLDYYNRICEVANESTNSSISRSSFIQLCQRSVSFPSSTILNLFNTLDYSGSEFISKSSLSCFLAVFLQTIDDQLENSFFPRTSSMVNVKELGKILQLLEGFFDPRSRTYSSAKIAILNYLINNFGDVAEKSSALELIKCNELFKPILDYFFAINQESINPSQIRIAEIQLKGSFTETSSPLSIHLTPPSQRGSGILNFEEVEMKLHRLIEEGVLNCEGEEGDPDCESPIILNVNSLESQTEKEQLNHNTQPLRILESSASIVDFPTIARDAREKIQRTCLRSCGNQCLLF